MIPEKSQDCIISLAISYSKPGAVKAGVKYQLDDMKISAGFLFLFYLFNDFLKIDCRRQSVNIEHIAQ
jgi:hypothetical protein